MLKVGDKYYRRVATPEHKGPYFVTNYRWDNNSTHYCMVDMLNIKTMKTVTHFIYNFYDEARLDFDYIKVDENYVEQLEDIL